MPEAAKAMHDHVAPGGGALEQSLTAPEKTVFQDQHISLVGADPTIFRR